MRLPQLTLTPWARFWFTVTAFLLLLTAIGCSTAWTSEATNIVNIILTALPAITSILGMAGVGLAPGTLAKVQGIITQAQNDFQNVVLPLIAKYQTAEASAQPGILSQLEVAVTSLSSQLSTLLPALHVDDPAKQAAIEQLVGPLVQEVTALEQLIPVLKGGLANHAEVKRRVAALMTHDEFKKVIDEAMANAREVFNADAGHTPAASKPKSS